MNKLMLSTLILASVTLSPLVSADHQTVTLGYAQSKIQNVGEIKGVNLKYRYEWDTPLSIISSFTYMGNEFNESWLAVKDRMKSQNKLTYYSLAIGPAYRFNNYISIYGLAGLNYNKADSKTHWSNYEHDRYRDMGYINKYSGKKTSFMYSAGLQINPVQNWTIDVAYEGSSFNDDVRTRSLNGFNIGAGYRF